MTEDTVPLFKKIASNALDWRGVVNLLKCSKQEFERWRDDGKFPEPDGEVLSHTFTSMNRAYNHMADGWLPETVGAIRPYIEDWRAEHKEALKIKKKKAKV